MQVEMWSLDRIKPYENNPRINDDAVDAVVQSINEFGLQHLSEFALVHCVDRLDCVEMFGQQDAAGVFARLRVGDLKCVGQLVEVLHARATRRRDGRSRLPLHFW